MNPRAFSTLGCPGADLDEVIRLARAGPCSGVELRCTEGESVHPDLDPEEADRIAGALRRAGLAVPVLASYVQVAADEPDVVDRLVRHIALAARFGAGQVRVLGGGAGDPHGRRERAVRHLARAAPVAEAAGVGIALETHDVFLTGAEVAAVLESVGSPAVGAVWDAVNPWRAGESPERTAALLGPWLRHVQLKDVASPTDLRPVLPGRGALPLGDVLAQLRRLGHQGWISLEWERAWHPEAAPLAEALAAFHQVLDTAA
ncbi:MULTISPECIES: sugar phosphate isomerase/epimerase family protein [unclassified Streptomyces]|uniref:sugar phosphate isomerase/epimerase family protein n=1 Tax=unclassified Streptomyces TaxID=2593676 RepID=UPI0038124C84